MPETAPSAPARSTRPTMIEREQAPVVTMFKGISKVHDFVSTRVDNAVKGVQSIDEPIQEFIRTEDPGEAEAQDLFFPPKAAAHAVGNIADGFILSKGRRIYEISKDIGNLVRSTYRTVTRPFTHPIKTFVDEEDKYLSNPGRIATSIGKLTRDVLNIPGRNLDEEVNRGIKRPAQNFGKIPLIGPLAGLLGKGAGWVANLPRRFGEWATQPFQDADEWMGAHQNA